MRRLRKPVTEGRPRGIQMEDRKFQLRRLHRAGRSVQVTIPPDLARAVGLKQGDQVYCYLVGHVLCFKRFDEGGFTPDVVGVTYHPQVDIELGE